MSNSIFNVFGGNENINPTNVLTSKNNQLGHRLGQGAPFSHLKGKYVGIGAPAPSQKRALGDVSNRIGNQQPTSSKKAPTKEHLQISTPLRNIINTPNKKLPQSSVKENPLQISQTWKSKEVHAPFHSTSQLVAEKFPLQQRTPVSMKKLRLATPISHQTATSVVSMPIQSIEAMCLEEPEIYPDCEEHEDSFFNDVIPEELCLNEEDFEHFFDSMRTSFHMSDYRVPPPSPELKEIDYNYSSEDDNIQSPLEIENMCVEFDFDLLLKVKEDNEMNI